MSFTDFVKPYPNGYEDGESGNTPVTAAILNTNYDGFLLALNTWASGMETSLNQKADSSSVGQAISAISGQLVNMQSDINQKSIVSLSDLLSTGTLIGTMTINGVTYDLYAPSGGSGGSSVEWEQIQLTGTKIAEVTIDGVTTDIYAPSGGSGGSGHTIIDENGTSMTARAGLQFVGGANVDDDATNNKTIVDLASAGGIDGVFIDAENVIQTSTTYTGSFTYTATEDCIVSLGYIVRSGVAFELKIDNVTVYDWASTYSGIGSQHLLIQLKKGQILSCTGDTQNASTYSVYGIQTGTTHSKFQPVIYSTEEREIGVWTDGKPLYEKTLELSSIPSTSPILIDVSALNIDVMASAIGEVYAISNGVIVETIVLPAYISQSYYGAIRFLNDNVQILHTGLGDYSSGKIVIQYTKTTDTAGSGTWTPQGVPAHHYSTDEQIVGTWNGETLYEKTYFNVSITNGANNLVESNFDSHRVLQNFSVSTKGMANTLFNYNSSVSDTLFVENGELKYYVSKTGSWWNALNKVDITIQYTKSS